MAMLAAQDVVIRRASPGEAEMVAAITRAAYARYVPLLGPVLLMKSSFFPQPSASPSIEEEVSERPNLKIVRFVNTGHLIHQEQFNTYITLAKEFFQA
jgi:hypothetical protein